MQEVYIGKSVQKLKWIKNVLGMKKLPKWVKSIPESQSHGSGTLQKRLWRLVSDFVRIRDWYTYNGQCIATGSKIRHWSEGDAGHWKSYSVCRGMFKFAPINIHLQSKSSNGWGGQEIGHTFGENLKRRYHSEILEEIQATNNRHPLKFTNEVIILMMQETLKEMGKLPEQPTYYKRGVFLMEK